MPIVHDKYTSNGQKFDITETGQKIYKSFIGQKNVDLGNDVFAPYAWDEPSQSIRYSNKVCEFDVDGFQVIREYGSTETLIDDQRFEVQYLQCNWRVLDLFQIGLTVDQQEDYCIVTRNLSDGEGNTLDIDFLFRPEEKVKNTFRLHVVDTDLTYRIRFQNSGIAGEVVEIPHIAKGVNSGIYKLRFDVIEFQWDKVEIDIHNYTVETQAQGKKLDIFLEGFFLDANGDVVISPDQWGENAITNTNDDCAEGSIDGVELEGVDSEGNPVGYVDITTYQAWDSSFRWQNVTIAGSPTSVDAGTQIEYECAWIDDPFNFEVYGLEGDTPAFNVTAPSARTKTAASATFASPAVGTRTVDGADFRAAIKEILDTSWSSGYDLGVMFEKGDSENDEVFQLYDYSNDSQYAGKITIVYTPAAGASAAITGTAQTDSITEADVVAGGETIIITLTNDTWIAA